MNSIFASLKKLKKIGIWFFTSFKKLKNCAGIFVQASKSSKNMNEIFCDLWKAQKTWIQYFASFKKLKNMNVIFATLQAFKWDSKKMTFIFFKIKIKTRIHFFSEERTSKKITDPLFWNLWKCKRYEFNLFASYKCSDMHKCKMLKLPNVSKIVNPICYKSKQYTKVLFNKMFFFKEWGQALRACVGPPGPPPFFGKNSIEKTVVYRLRL